jgi:hypothetical protein
MDHYAAKNKLSKQFNIILDSGAFSAWRLGNPIDLAEYCDWLGENMDWVGHSVALDVIDPLNPEKAAEKSLRNYEYMIKQGLDPIPVVHVGERFEWLHELIKMGASYVGFSASSIIDRRGIDSWYAHAFNQIVDEAGLPGIRVHAFGEGRVSALLQFPWYSADSTSWLYTSQRVGVLQLPNGNKVGFRADEKGAAGAKDVGKLSKLERRDLISYLTGLHVDIGVLEERKSRAAFVTRAYIAAIFYVRLQERIRALQPIRYQMAGFGLADPPKRYKAIPPFKFNMHLVAGGNYTAFAALAACPHENILASYYYLKNGGHHKHLRAFVLDCEEALKLPSFQSHYANLVDNLTEREGLDK